MPTIGGLLAALLACCAAFTVTAYWSASRVRRRAACAFEDDEPLPWWVRAAAAVREGAVTLLVFLPVPLARQHQARTTRPPVVLLHGHAQPASSCRWLARRLRRDGWDVHVLRYPVFGGDVRRSAVAIAGAIDAAREQSGADTVDVVAHGLGGLVARACLRERGAAAGVRRLVTLGTPHRGTAALTWFGLGAMLRQARPGSPLLAWLSADDPVPAIVDVVALHSLDDALVIPDENAYYPGAFNIQLRAVGHFSLLVSARVYDLVRENLAPVAAVMPAAAVLRAPEHA